MNHADATWGNSQRYAAQRSGDAADVRRARRASSAGIAIRSQPAAVSNPEEATELALQSRPIPGAVLNRYTR
jgi:hypothetical protein